MRTFFQDVCPSELIRSFNKLSRQLILFNGSEIVFRSLDSPDKIKLDLGFFYIDEASEIDELTFLTLVGRLRHPNVRQCGFLTSNPVNVTHWLYKYFVAQRTEDFEEFHGSTYLNKENLPEGYIESLEKNYPPTWRKKYLEGEWGFSLESQPVFSEFREDLHVKDLRYLTEEEMYVGLDFGFFHPAALFTQLDDRDRWLVLAEFQPENITAHEFARRLIEFQNKRFPYVSKFIYYGDPAARQRSDKNEKTTAEIFRDHGINILSRASSVAARVEIINKRLATLTDGKPCLLIDKSCKTLIDALSGGYHYKVNKDEPEHDSYYCHLTDSLGYIAVGLFSVKDASVLRRDYLPQRLANWRFKK